MKKFLVAAIVGLAGLAAFAGTCTIQNILLTAISGHDVFAGELHNDSGANFLQHTVLVAFIDSSNNLVETKTADTCLRSLQNGRANFFSATANAADTTTSVGLARMAFDSTLKAGTTATGDVTYTSMTFIRTGTTLTVKGTITNNDSDKLFDPAVCAVVRDTSGRVVIVEKDTSLNDLPDGSSDTFTITITVPEDDNIVDTVDLWTDGLDGSSSGTPITPESDLDNAVTTGANKLVFTTQPVGGVLINANFGTMPIVKLEDAAGNVLTATDNVTLAVKAGTAPAGTVLTCTNNTVAAVSGVATFAGCKLNHAASGIVLTATASGYTSADSSGININPGAADHLFFSTNPSNSTGGIAFSAQPVVQVLDANNDVVWNDNATVVTLALTGTGTLTCNPASNAKTVVAGVATFVTCSVNTAGNGKTLGATSVPVYTAATSASFNITVGPAAKLVFNPEPTTPTASGVNFGTQPLVEVRDAGDNVVTTSTASVTLTLQAVTNGPGTLACTTNPVAAATGVATFAGCNITDADGGTYTITAASTGLTSDITATLTINP